MIELSIYGVIEHIGELKEKPNIAKRVISIRQIGCTKNPVYSMEVINHKLEQLTKFKKNDMVMADCVLHGANPPLLNFISLELITLKQTQ